MCGSSSSVGTTIVMMLRWRMKTTQLMPSAMPGWSKRCRGCGRRPVRFGHRPRGPPGEAQGRAKGEGEEAQGRRRSLCQENYIDKISAVLAATKYAAVADFQAKMAKEVKEAEARALITGHEGAESVGARGAAEVDGRARRRAEYEEQYDPNCDTLLAANGYATAANLHDEMETRITDEEARARRPSAAGHGHITYTKADAAGACQAMTAR